MNAVVLLIAGFMAIAVGSVWLRYIPPFGDRTLLRIKNGTLCVSRGQLHAHAREAATEILSGFVKSGFIAITDERRVVFSRQIPAELHQRLRNALLNH